MLPPISFILGMGYHPLKVQAGIVTNKGNNDIYLFGVEDDVPISNLAQLQAFSFCILGPGQSVNIEINPHIGYLKNTDRDKHITIHSQFVIEVDIESNDLPTSWNQDPRHPWNGGVLPNGQYTDRYGGLLIPTGIIASIGPTTLSLPKPSPGVVFTIKQPIEWVTVTVNIDCGPKCTCGEKSTKHPGRCSSWCDLEKGKNV